MTERRAPTQPQIEAARERLADVLVRTPLVPFPGVDDLWLKPEIHQPGGCFKVRGVHNALLCMDPERRAQGVSTVSAGNTAKALAWSARRFGVEARSLMPEHAPHTKVEAMRALGGTPVLVPVEEVFAFLREERWHAEPYAFVHPWFDRDLLAGHGTLGAEIALELPEVDSVFVPVGGGGLLGGVGSALRAWKPDVRIYAVEPAGCPSLSAAIDAGRPVDVACETMCDGVAVPYVTDEMFGLLRELADRVVLVEESDVRAAIRRLAAKAHVVAEGAGALAFAAACSIPAEERGRSVCLVTGGSIDTAKLLDVLSE